MINLVIARRQVLGEWGEVAVGGFASDEVAVWTDQTIRQDDLGDGHAEASDQYLNELKHHPRRRLLKDKVLIGEWERRKRCPEPCERHDLLVEEGREPSLPSGQRKKSQRGEKRGGRA